MGLISLGELKKVVIRLIEIIAISSVGLLFTVYILKPIYENFRILFIRNVWVNWFGVSYILFVLSTLIVGLCIPNKETLRLWRVLHFYTNNDTNTTVILPRI